MGGAVLGADGDRSHLPLSISANPRLGAGSNLRMVSAPAAVPAVGGRIFSYAD